MSDASRAADAAGQAVLIDAEPRSDRGAEPMLRGDTELASHQEQSRGALVAPAPAQSLLQMLQDEPWRFEFDAAVAVMMHAAGRGDPAAAIRFHAPTGLGFVSADVLAVGREGIPSDWLRDREELV